MWSIKAGRPGLNSREVFRVFSAKVFKLVLIWHCQDWHLEKNLGNHLLLKMMAVGPERQKHKATDKAGARG